MKSMKKVLYAIVLSVIAFLPLLVSHSMAYEEDYPDGTHDSAFNGTKTEIIGDMRYYYNPEKQTATFCEYLGDETEVTIPETIVVSGGAVTCEVIAVDYYSPLHYERPETNVSTYNLPKTIAYIDNYAFEFDKNVQNFYVNEENLFFKDKDGVIYSKDGKRIIKFPSGRTGEYHLEESTEIIEEYAFVNMQLSKIICNSNLKEIRSASIQSINSHSIIGDTTNTFEIVLNEGLTHIACFGIMANMKNIYIPSSVKYIAYCDTKDYLYEYYMDDVKMAMPGFFIGSSSYLENIIVNENNPYWSSYDGMLFNKDKTILYYCPLGKNNVIIPDFTKSIESYAIRLINNSDVYVPTSIVSIGEVNFNRRVISESAFKNTIVCYKNSTAYNYAIANNLPYRLLDDSANDLDEDNSDDSNSNSSSSANIKPSVNISTSNTWSQTDGKWQYVKPNGQYAKNEWLFIKDKWYYFGNDTNMVTEWKIINGEWYYLDSVNGDMKIGWHFWRNQWYYLNPNGDMAVGWKKVDGKWYFLDSNGNMVTGWKLIDGKWYYMTGNGDCLLNTVTPDGYTVDENGAWIK